MTTLEKLLLAYPFENWDWNQVSVNPAVTFQFILDHPKLPWRSRYVSENANVTEQIILSNMSYHWCFTGLCANKNLTFEFFKKYIIVPNEVMHVDWQLLSANPAVTTMDIINNPTYNWNDRYLSSNPNITSNFILNEGKIRKWFFPSICSNSGITATDIFKSTLKSFGEWNYKTLSDNINLPTMYVHNNLNKDWNFHSISMHTSINDFESFRRIPWDIHGLSSNINITFDYVKNNPDLPWDYPSLLMNNSIRLDEILENYDWFYNRWTLSQPMETFILSNETITFDWIKKNEKYVDWKRLSRNAFNQIM